MSTPIATLGALEMRLASVEYGVFRAGRVSPFLLLDDGTEVQTFTRESRRYLLVDHRRDADVRARVEFWEVAAAPELGVDGLYAVVEASLG